MKVRTSELDGETIVIEIEDGVPVPTAIVDGRLLRENWFTYNHLLAIEAHELGHIRMESKEESIAEREGIRLLKAAGKKEAADLLIERGIA